VLYGSSLSAEDICDDKRRVKRLARELTERGWLVDDGGLPAPANRLRITDDALAVLARKPPGPIVLPNGLGEHNRYYAIAETTSRPTDEIATFLWALLHPTEYVWAWVWGHMDDDKRRPWAPVAPKAPAEWPAALRQAFNAERKWAPTLIVSDAASITAWSECEARRLWAEWANRIDDAIPHVLKQESRAKRSGRGFFIPSSSPNHVAESWEDVMRSQIERAEAELVEAQKALAALHEERERAAKLMGSDRPYDAIRARWEQEIAESVIRETGVDPRSLSKKG